MDGYAGSILYVDLTKGSVQKKPLPGELKKQYLGGRGFGVKLVSDLVPPKADPLGEKNVIVFATGPLTGTGVPLGGRHQVVSKSPLNNTLCSSDSGAFFGHEMKSRRVRCSRCEREGKEARVLWLNNGRQRSGTLRHTGGRQFLRRLLAIQKDIGDNLIRIACIGPAGEKLSLIACVMSDQFRAAGRGGLGAVMGSKNLKAVAVRGCWKDSSRRSVKFKEAVESARKKIQAGQVTSQSLSDYGTDVLMNLINNNYILPTRNHQSAYFPTADNVSGETMAKTTLVRKKPCYGCFVACGRGTKIDGIEGEGPEYENAWAFGADCGIDDLAWVTRANNFCNDLGLDAISAGVTIACAMELSQRGFIREKICMG